MKLRELARAHRKLHWIATGYAVLFASLGFFWDDHPRHVGFAFVIFGVFWSATNYGVGRDPASLQNLARSRLWLRRLELGRRRLSDEEWIEKDARTQGWMARVHAWFGLVFVAAGVLIMVRGQ
jgi:hypothetical protein